MSISNHKMRITGFDTFCVEVRMVWVLNQDCVWSVDCVWCVEFSKWGHWKGERKTLWLPWGQVLSPINQKLCMTGFDTFCVEVRIVWVSYLDCVWSVDCVWCVKVSKQGHWEGEQKTLITLMANTKSNQLPIYVGSTHFLLMLRWFEFLKLDCVWSVDCLSNP